MRRLHYTLRGIHLVQGNSFARPRRSPITISHLYQLIRFVSGSSLGPNDCALFTAVTLIAFFGLLRVSENTCLSQTFDLTSHLSVQDVTLTRQVVHLHIKASKTNPFRAGVTVWVPAISSALCLVSAIYIFTSEVPLFLFQDGQNVMVVTPRTCNGINTHSFRIGGAKA